MVQSVPEVEEPVTIQFKPLKVMVMSWLIAFASLSALTTNPEGDSPPIKTIGAVAEEA